MNVCKHGDCCVVYEKAVCPMCASTDKVDGLGDEIVDLEAKLKEALEELEDLKGGVSKL